MHRSSKILFTASGLAGMFFFLLRDIAAATKWGEYSLLLIGLYLGANQVQKYFQARGDKK